MKRYHREIAVARPAAEVFDFFADMRRLTEWAPEDFDSVERQGNASIARGTSFVFVTNGARATSTFVWETFERPKQLRFSGPRLNVGPGWVEGLGGYDFSERDGTTVVRAWYEPTLGGFLALMSPFGRMRNIRLLGKQLARAKALLESRAS